MPVKQKTTTKVPIAVTNGEIKCKPKTRTPKDSRVEWKCGTHAWKVDFVKDSPLEKDTLGPKDANRPDGANVKATGVKFNHPYKYTVSVKINNKWEDLDPELIVDA